MSCEMIRDLIPLYADKTASTASRKAVADHLVHCEACRDFYAIFLHERRAARNMHLAENRREAQNISCPTREKRYAQLAGRLRRRKKRMDAANALFLSLFCAAGCYAAFSLLSRQED